MASRANVVAALMREIGKLSPDIQADLDQVVGEVTVDLLSQNEGRFKALECTVSIDVSISDKKYLLPANFNTAKTTFYEVDDDAEFVAECEVLAKSTINRKRADSEPLSYRHCYIEDDPPDETEPGKYLVLADLPTAATHFELDYYRTPTENDTDKIRNVAIVKSGVRARRPAYFPTAITEVGIYENMKAGFREDPEKNVTKIMVKPSRRITKFNRRMHDIGAGR